MSAKIQSNTPRIAQNRQEPPAPVEQKGPAAKAEAPSPADTPAAHSTDGFERTSAQSAKQQEFDKKFGATSQEVIKQTSDENCGPAAALMAAGVKAGGSAAKQMEELEKKFTDGKGTSAQQMSQMLAHEGVAVNQAAYKYDQAAVDQSLSKGGKMLALVDSNQINPGANGQEAGNAHWVVVDGKDSQGNYKVKDPGTGSAYDIDFSKLSNAIDQSWLKHQTGGMLLVDDAAGSAPAAGLAQANLDMTQPVPTGPGIGSKGDLLIGRESS